MTAALQRIRAPFLAEGYTGLALEWKTATRLITLGIGWLAAKWAFRGAGRVGRRVIAYGLPTVRLARGSQLELGDEVRVESGVHRARLSVHAGGRLTVGDDVYLNGCIISAATEVRIGSRVRIGPWAHLMDGDFHQVGDYAGAGPSAPIVIGDGAWLATRCMVLKGVTVGEGAVVAAGAVVVRDVPPHTVVAGVPARVIKELPRTASGQAPEREAA